MFPDGSKRKQPARGPAAQSWPSCVARADGNAQSVLTWGLQRFDTPGEQKTPKRLRVKRTYHAAVGTPAHASRLWMTACLHWPLHRRCWPHPAPMAAARTRARRPGLSTGGRQGCVRQGCDGKGRGRHYAATRRSRINLAAAPSISASRPVCPKARLSTCPRSNDRERRWPRVSTLKRNATRAHGQCLDEPDAPPRTQRTLRCNVDSVNN